MATIAVDPQALPQRHRLAVPAALQAGREDEAIALVAEYLAAKADGPVHTGAVFDTIGAGWDGPGGAYAITPGDLVALSMLHAEVPARAAIDILDRQAGKISSLLARIDPAAQLVDTADDVMIDRGSPGNQLWFLLSARRGRSGLGPTTTSKLLARKRPDLFPLHDPGVGARVGWTTTRNFWRELRTELQADDRALWLRLNRVNDLAAPDRRLAPLRIFDIVTWMQSRPRQPVLPAQPVPPAQPVLPAQPVVPAQRTAGTGPCTPRRALICSVVPPAPSRVGRQD